MSTNNQLIILKKGMLFCIHENLCVDNDFKPNKNTLIKTEKTLINAIKYAKKYANEEMVEYGVYIDDSCLNEVKNTHNKNRNKI